MKIWCNYETAFWISSPGVIFVNKFIIIIIIILYNLLIIVVMI